jgi:hypothetical protein
VSRERVPSSGRRRPEAYDAKDLIGGEGEDGEHEVALDLDGASHARKPSSELVLQSSVYAFDHGAEIVDDVVGDVDVDEFAPLDFVTPFGLELSL